MAKYTILMSCGHEDTVDLIGKTSDTCQVEIVQEPHLHLGVKQGGKWIDPMSVIGTVVTAE